MTSTRSSREERKNSQFRRVFWWQLKHNRIFIAFYVGALAGGLPIGFLLGIIGTMGRYTDMSEWEGYTVEQVMELFGGNVWQAYNDLLVSMVIPICIIYAVCYCVRSFGYMQNRRSVDLFHALPIQRKPLLLGSYAAGVVSLLVPLALAVGAAEGICVYYHVPAPMTAAAFWTGYAIVGLTMTAALTMVMFFMVTSGSILNTVLSLGAVAFGWPLTCAVVDSTMGLFLPGYVSVIPRAAYTALCPFAAAYNVIPYSFYYFFSGVVGYADGNWEYSVSVWYVLWWVLFTLAMLLGAVACYLARKSECAEDNFSFAIVRGFIRALVTVCCGLCLGEVLGEVLDSNTVYLAGILIGAVSAHLVFQVVMVRGFRGIWKTVPACVVVLGAMTGFLYSLYGGGLGYVTRVPAAGEVEKVTTGMPAVNGEDSREGYLAQKVNAIEMVSRDYDYIGSAEPEFRGEEEAALITAFHQSLLRKCPGPYLPFERKKDYQNSYAMSFFYTLSDGRVMNRQYQLPLYSEDEDILAALAAIQTSDVYQQFALYYYTEAGDIGGVSVSEEEVDFWYNASQYELTDEEKQELWQTFTEELNSPDFTWPVKLNSEASAVEISTMADSSAPGELQTLFGGSRYSEEFVREEYVPTYGRTYYISCNNLQLRSPELRALLEKYGTDTVNLDRVTMITDENDSYEVPECCVRTRALIDRLTEGQGEYGYYNEYEDSEPEIDPADLQDMADASR